MSNRIISGTAFWAHVLTPNTRFDPDGEWSIEICNLDATNKKIAEDDGLSIKNKSDDRGDFVASSSMPVPVMEYPVVCL